MNGMLKAKLKHFAQDTSASIAIAGAMSFVLLVAVAGFAVDVSNATTTKGRLQRIADASAMGAIEFMPNKAKAKNIVGAAAKFIKLSSDGNVVHPADIEYGDWDPRNRAFTPNPSSIRAVRVTAKRSVSNGNLLPTYFMKYFGSAWGDIEAVAIAAQNVTELCVIARSLDSWGSFRTDADCGIQVNSASSSAFNMGGAFVHQSDVPIKVVGDVSGVSQADFEVGQDPAYFDPPDASIMRDTTDPCIDGGGRLIITTNTTLPPGVYCQGLRVVGNVTITFAPGVHVFRKAVEITKNPGPGRGSAILNGSGVTIAFEQDGRFQIGPTTDVTINLGPPSTGNYAGYTILQRTSAAENLNYVHGALEFSGQFYGAVYTPDMDYDVTGSFAMKSDRSKLASYALRDVKVSGSYDIAIEHSELNASASGGSSGATATLVN